MRASEAEYRSLPLRGHELLRDVPLYDVSSVDFLEAAAGGPSRTFVRSSPRRLRAYRDFPLRPPIFLGTDIPLGSTTDAAGRLIFGMPVGTRPTRLRNNARYSGWPPLGLLSICGRNSS